MNGLEDVVINSLSYWKVAAKRHKDRPGVFVGDAKIASLGLRILRGCSYHGISLNVNMDLSPWNLVKPCGLDITMTQLSDLVDLNISNNDVCKILAAQLCNTFGYENKNAVTSPFSMAD